MIDLAILPRPLRFWKGTMVKGAVPVPAVSFFGPPVIDGEIMDRHYRHQILVRIETTAREILFGDLTPIEIDGLGFLGQLESIDEGDYLYMRDVAAYATTYRPDKPEAAPTTKVDRRGRSVW